jgi:hypothetical protein
MAATCYKYVTLVTRHGCDVLQTCHTCLSLLSERNRSERTDPTHRAEPTNQTETDGKTQYIRRYQSNLTWRKTHDTSNLWEAKASPPNWADHTHMHTHAQDSKKPIVGNPQVFKNLLGPDARWHPSHHCISPLYTICRVRPCQQSNVRERQFIGLGFRVYGFRVYGFRVAGFRVLGLRFYDCRVFGFWVLGFRV